MSIRDSYYFALLEIHNGRPVAVETRFKGQEGDLTRLSRTVCRIKKQEDGTLRPTLGMDESEGCNVYTDPLTPRERLIILGGGHIALPLCEFAAKCDFAVTVVDDRPEFANTERFPWAKQVICGDFDAALAGLHITPYDYVVIITRGHSHDADCLRCLLRQREAAYTGMIGSRYRVSAQMQMLREEGFDAERLERVCTPIGLSIGAATPVEIAVSILSQLIEYKRVKSAGTRLINDSDLDVTVIEELMKVQEPVGLATVIETRGSSPRGAGAMMYVYPNGRIVGTIGGGSGEARILKETREIIGTGRYRVVEINMNSSVAAADGMACGGVMSVLVEDIPLDIYDD